MMNRLLFFSLPFDFMRVFWIITPFDIVAATYLIRRALIGNLDRRLLILLIGLMVPLLSIVLMGAIVNSTVAEQNIILLIGILISGLKGFALVDCAVRDKGVDLKALAMGFIIINIFSLAILLEGLGLSGAGRAQGLLNHSNAFGVLQAFSIALALSILNRHLLLSASLVALSIPLAVLSGSRGALVTIAILLVIFVIFNIKPTARGFVVAFLALTAIVMTFFGNATFLIEYLAGSEWKGAVRISSFLNAVINYNMGPTLGLVSEFQTARGGLNAAAIEQFWREPRIFGVGYGEALPVIDSTARPHNFVLSTLIELGPLASIFLSFLVAVSGFYVISLTVYDRSCLWILLFFACFVLASFRTPFYFLAALPWFLILFAIYAGVYRKNLIV